MPTPPRAPAGLQTEGKKLWKQVLTDHTLASWELEILEGACRTKDIMSVLDADIRASKLKTTGSMGQEILNDSVKERRMQEQHYIKLLTSLNLPNAAQLAATAKGAAQTRQAAPARSAHARKAARARWEPSTAPPTK